jgi:hypothetical protein
VRGLTWKQAALLISPLLASKKPKGFQTFTPDAWLDWAVGELAASETSVTVVTVSDLYPELDPLIELLRKPDGPAH